MTSRTPLPSDLRQWVTHHRPGLAAVTDVSWPRPDSQVWRVTTSSGADAYVKISPNPRSFAREVHAYHHAARALDAGEAPRLLSADPDLRAILTTPLPGVIVKDHALSTEHEYRAHECAGRLLRKWHALDPPEVHGAEREDAITSVTSRTDTAATIHLANTAHLITSAQRRLVERACQELPELATVLPLVFRHGDFAPRNWMWDPDHPAVAVLDFENADHGFAVEELVWLYATTWPQRPDLRTACLTGYGRPLHENEERALPLFTALAALGYLNAGITLHQPTLTAKAQAAFDHAITA